MRRKVTLTIAISGDATLRKLNKTFLDIDAPTDVLAFPSQNDDDEYLGDVVVSMMRVRAQAKSGGHEMIDELRLLVIHGVLHLLGHDHDTQANKKRMWAAQTRALKKIGAAIEGAR